MDLGLTHIILLYMEGNLTLDVVTTCELLPATVRSHSWNNTDTKFGCSVKMDRLGQIVFYSNQLMHSF